MARLLKSTSQGGWLDQHRISPAPIDEDGNAEVEDDRGRTFSVHVDPPDSSEQEESGAEGKKNGVIGGTVASGV